MLGNAQLTQYENDPDTDRGKQFLVDAKKSFQASIQMEGKPNVGDAPFDLTGIKMDTCSLQCYLYSLSVPVLLNWNEHFRFRFVMTYVH